MLNLSHLENKGTGDVVQGHSMPSTHKALGWISSILKQTKQKKLRKHRRI
jgi:hypothetical protein